MLRTTTLVAAALLAGTASAQMGVDRSQRVPFPADTGWVANASDHTATIAALPVHVEGAAWLRLSFDAVDLARGAARATMRITSLTDGHVQVLDQRTIEEWRHTSAYFNGDTVLVELVAEPGPEVSRVVVSEVTAGLLGPLQSICGSGDERELSTDVRMARILPAICTGFLIDQACGSCLLTAGHCAGGLEVLEFNVPVSNNFGQMVHPGPDDQYAVDPASIQTSGTASSIGDDWAFFGVFDNPNTGARPLEAQGDRFKFSVAPTYAPGQQIRITGYGSRFEPPAYNRAQQTSVGTRLPALTVLEYQTDTTGGNSGSPVVLEETGEAIGIHTHGGCATASGNRGTRATHLPLMEALANPAGVCALARAGKALTYGDGVGGANVAVLASPAPPTVTTGLQLTLSGVPGADTGVVWFAMDALDVPILGGRLLADAVNAFHWQAFDPVGEGLELDLAVPATICAFPIFAQAFVPDARQLSGVALSNGLEIQIGE